MPLDKPFPKGLPHRVPLFEVAEPSAERAPQSSGMADATFPVNPVWPNRAVESLVVDGI